MTARQTKPAQTPKVEAVAAPYRKILVALDRVGGAPEIFTRALSLARTYQSQLLAFHCLSYMTDSRELMATGGMGFYVPESIYYPGRIAQDTVDDLTQWLKEWQKRANSCEIACEFDYHIGDPGQEICAAARRWQADLIVVGRRDRSGIEELLLGSTSNYVMHHAPCSVLIVHDEVASTTKNGASD